MKRNNKKGFTIVELVIVIAVIAILSAVLIPTFGGIVDKANESARDQEAANLYKTYLIDHDYVSTPLDQLDGVILIDKYVYNVVDGQLTTDGDQKEYTTAPAADTVIAHNAACADGTTDDGHCDVCHSIVEEHDATGCTICTPAAGN